MNIMRDAWLMHRIDPGVPFSYHLRLAWKFASYDRLDAIGAELNAVWRG